jgi:D-glucuronyl C5-epimerase-like protein/PASTA domain-containing protein
MIRSAGLVALLASAAAVLTLTAGAFGSSGDRAAGAPFVSHSGTCPSAAGETTFTVPISADHPDPVAELTADGPATLRDAHGGGVDTGGAGTVWEPWGESLSAGDSVNVEVDCSGSTDVSFTFNLYDAPSTPFTVSGAGTSCPTCSARNDIRFSAPGTAHYVADLTLTQGSVDLSGGPSDQVFASSGRYDLGRLDQGARDLYLTPLAGPTAKWSLSIHALPACHVPRVTGRSLAKAKLAIRRAGCSVGTISRKTASPRLKGRVVSQKPRHGRVLRKGARVRLWVGSEPKRVLAGAPSDRQTASGLVLRYYAGSGWQFQPLLSFEHLNNLVSAGQAGAAQRLVEALLARGRRQGAALYWRYDFPFAGGPVPWSSGFVQAVAAQSLARAGKLLGRPALLKPAGAALLGLRQGLLLHVGGGLWIREYGFTRQVILNSQLQSLISLHSYAQLVDTPQTDRLVGSLYRATVRLLPRFDLGCHSLYQLGGPVADHHYQDYHVELLKRLAGLYPQEPLFGRLYVRWRRCA